MQRTNLWIGGLQIDAFTKLPGIKKRKLVRQVEGEILFGGSEYGLFESECLLRGKREQVA